MAPRKTPETSGKILVTNKLDEILKPDIVPGEGLDAIIEPDIVANEAARYEAEKNVVKGTRVATAKLSNETTVDPTKQALAEIGDAVGASEETRNLIGKVVDVAKDFDANNKQQFVRDLTANLKEELKKPENKNSLFLNASYQICSIVEKYFGMTMGAAEYAGSIDVMYKDVDFGEMLNGIYSKHEMGKLISEYEKIRDSDPYTPAKGNPIKEKIITYAQQAGFDIKTEDFDKDLVKFKKRLNKIANDAISEDLILQLGGDDTAISAHYVYGMLTGFQAGDKNGLDVKATGNPEELYATLMKAKNPNGGYSYNHVVKPIDLGEGQMPEGTILSYNVVSPTGDSNLLMGIVDADGKVRVATSLYGGVPQAVPDLGRFIDQIAKKQAENAKSTFSFMGTAATLVTTMSPEVRFRGAFIPKPQSVTEREVYYKKRKVIAGPTRPKEKEADKKPGE